MIDAADLIAMVADHAGLARLCTSLEEMADRLPAFPSPEEAADLQADLLYFLPAHAAREEGLARHLLGREACLRGGPAILCQIEDSRAACTDRARLLALTLAPGASATALGYRVRDFFEACRQAMAFEELAVLHLIGGQLTPQARALLLGSLVRRCAG